MDMRMRKELIFIIIGTFLLGWVANAVVSTLYDNTEMPANLNITKERSSPSDWINENNIHVYPDRIVIDIDNAKWASFTDTNSMDPVFDSTANAIEIVPSSPDFIQVGDIVAYESSYANGVIIHRVIGKGTDDKGVFFVVKGDNNDSQDPGKIRFEQIKRVLVAVIY